MTKKRDLRGLVALSAKVLAVSFLLGGFGLVSLAGVLEWVSTTSSELLQRVLFLYAFADYLLISLFVFGPLYILYRIWYELKGKKLLQTI